MKTDQLTDRIKFINADCMDVMAQYPNKYFDLAIVDPPYGLSDKLRIGGDTGVVKFHKMNVQWDHIKPTQEYFNELFRVSHNQIIWGGNYFELPPSRGVISWDKNIGHPINFSHWELGWTSFDCIARKVKISSNTGNLIHPTQKPVKLYEWIYHNYAKPEYKILDTHLGSGSNAIAAHNYGISEFIGIELDPEYYADSIKRFNRVTSQLRMF